MLLKLAHACDIEFRYRAAREERIAPEHTIRRALAAMGVAAGDEDEARASLEAVRLRPWRQPVQPSVVLRSDQRSSVSLHLPAGARAQAWITLEDGGVRTVPAADWQDPDGQAIQVDGRLLSAGALALPSDLPLGYHRLTVRADTAAEQITADCTLVVAPHRAPLPVGQARTWGWMLQLYSLRSAASWGMGDLADLAELAQWSGDELGAAFLVCNPLHAAAPIPPQEPSPYLPSSRRYTNPLYLRVEDIPEVRALTGDARAEVQGLAERLRKMNREDRIDRDEIHTAKMRAFELAFANADHRPGFEAYRRREGQALEDFAIFCALAERHGLPFQAWPAPLRHPRGDAVAAARNELAERVGFHAWLQFCCDEQLGRAQAVARSAGMPVGIVHDLAVGVDGGGADAWALQDHLAADFTVGAPPDAFNQQGQDWAQPPLLPNRLAETGFAPFRDMLRSVLRHAGGIRIDHVLALFRLFWIPEGGSPAEGTYVRYPAEDLLGVLALEATRAGALVVGEDLGTVADGVRDRLRESSILGSRVLYFERDDEGAAVPASDYAVEALASVNTHDLPTAVGWWAGEDVRIRVERDLLGSDTDAEQEWRARQADRTLITELLADAGLLEADQPRVPELVAAMHAFLARTPCLLVALSLGDAVGDLRQPNLPGTTTEYPNWRLPIARPTACGHKPLLMEDLRRHPGLQRHVSVVREWRD